MPISRLAAWVIWTTASIFYAYQYILRVMPNIMLQDFIQQFHIDSTIFGQFSGVYYIGYALMHLPLGILLDRYGPKKIMTACILLSVIGLLPVLFAEHWIYPVIGRMLIGMGSSAAILGIFKIIRMTFTEKQFTRMLSLSVTIGLIGAIYGGGPVSALTESLGYKNVVQIFIGFGLILAGMTYFIIPDLEQKRTESVLSDLKSVLMNKKVIMICLLAGLMVGPLEGFADVWGAAFLQKIYGFSHENSSYLTSMIFVGMCFGAPVLSYIGEKTGNYLAVIGAAGAFMMFCFLVLISGQLTSHSMVASFLLIGTCSAYQILAIYKASTYVPEQVAGLTTAVANMIIMSFGYAFHSLIGLVVNHFGGTTVSKAFIYGISIIPIGLGIAVLGFLALLYKERNKMIAA
ncbi:MFS transporter [Legionella spiritensis]|uniref:MFS transporter n=1 Tax=Legionella spiritensis TaxID=452 RepID=UPI000F6FDB0E|nr:MFS transporter [Legionella spiritensis]VEG90315.1 major facilitator family transporter [Legionella spiritensis]